MAIAPELRAQILRLYQAERWRVGTIASLRISAIVDACFRLIVDGESVLPWRRWGSAQELV